MLTGQICHRFIAKFQSLFRGSEKYFLFFCCPVYPGWHTADIQAAIYMHSASGLHAARIVT
jgi:hypothetical protein